ncbi:sugar phosphate isomerase/epimerase [Enterobacteriaceae bacterium 4M9]|nr:sugar phosphate isomerase/epimerase [Enterobacteriaceae bacterium 4M9]
MERKIIVVTAAYDRDCITALGGQAAVLPIIAAAGADGVEIRRELLNSASTDELSALAHAIATHPLMACYSAPEALYLDDSTLNPAIPALLHEASLINADWLKLSLGHYQPTRAQFSTLQQWLAQSQVRLVVENDQTAFGRLAPMQRFAADSRAHNLPVPLTFDMANWLWVDESPEEAAQRLAPSVGYIHVKAASVGERGVHAIALDDAGPRWPALLNMLPPDAPRGIEFPLQGSNLTDVTRHYVNLLRKE